MSLILEAERMNKVYVIRKGSTQQILHNVDLSISRGEFVSVMGPSGSGKSTLLYNISGMDRASSGSIRFCGKELSAMEEEGLSALRLASMGFVFQQSSLLKNLNILDNIVLPAYMAKRENRKVILKRAVQLMQQTGIGDLQDHDITQVSGGQLQRAAICRALINNPEILFGDEPTGALNSSAADEVMEIFSAMNQEGTTILLVTHDVRVAARTERVVFMSDGAVAGEKKLGKYEKGTSWKSREQQLTTWLYEMGF